MSSMPAFHGTVLRAVLFVCVLVVPTSSFAQTGETAAPRMAATAEGISNPVVLDAYHAQVAIHGVLAKTSVTLGFSNRYERDLEGELVFQLPEGATVTGYALDVGDAMVDAVAVGKGVGRIAFETEARGAIDPGLVEWVDGNVFRTKIYPVPGEGRRQIRIDYVSLLERKGSRGRYSLPMEGLPPLENLDVEFDVCGSTGSAPVLQGAAAALDDEKKDGCVHGSGSFGDAQPEDDLVIEIGIPVPSAVQTDRADGGVTFFVVSSLVPDNLDVNRQRPSPSRPLLLWDASASRRDVDHQTGVEAVLRLVEQWRPAEIALAVLRDEAEAPRPFRVDRGSADELEDAVLDLVYDGGSRFDREAAWTGVYPDTVILVSDGRPTMGSAVFPDLGVPVFTLSVSNAANRAYLRDVADSTGGSYIDLSRSGDSDWMSVIDRVPASLSKVEVLEGSIRELNAPIGRPVGAATVISGILESESARLRLHYGDRGRGPWLDVEVLNGRGSGFEVLFWATQRLAALVPLLNDHRSEIRSLGLNHDLVTPLTSLIVLEDADQYARYRIEPPESLPEIRDEYFDLLEEQIEEWTDLEEEYKEDLREEWVDPPERTAPPQASPPDDGLRQAERITVDASTTVTGSALPDEVTDEMIEPAMERSFEGEITVSGSFRPGSAAVIGEDAVMVSPWKKDTPYLEVLDKASRADRYEAYLGQRAAFAESPGFYVDCARLFLEKQQVDLGLRVLSNLLEIHDDEPRLLRVAAMLYLEYGRIDIAVELFERLTEIRPEHPQSNRDLALALVERARAWARAGAQGARDDLERAAGLLLEVIFRPWGPVPDHLKSLYLEMEIFPEIGQIGLVDLNALVQRYRRWFREIPDAVLDLDPVFVRKVEADLRIVITWDDVFADIDLRVIDPAGELVWYSHPVSEAGGVLSEDYTEGLGPEVFTIVRAPVGLYRVEVDYFADDGPSVVGPVTVLTSITTDLGRPTERTVLRSTRLDLVEETMEVASVTIGMPDEGDDLQE